ncbi:MAG: hypothetical protein HY682_07505 [Chloroflexi bacterium]|nr:hypothetical protein [Chloroflexota bacterium]
MIATATAGVRQAEIATSVRSRPTVLRKVFSDKPETSGWLRAVAFAAAAWSIVTLLVVGAPPLIPLISLIGIAAGHLFSYRRIGRSTPFVSLAIGIFIVALGIYMRNDLVAAIRGDRLPVAYFMLATGAASAFDLRTRASLYTQLLFAGIVIFFASEIAFAASFAPLLATYALLAMGFFARSWLEDETQGRKKIGLKTPGGKVLVWAGIGAGVVASGALAFFLLPWNKAQTPHAPQFAVLPFSGTENGEIPPLSPEAARRLTQQRQASLGELSASASSGQGAGSGDMLAGAVGEGGVGIPGVQELGKDGLSVDVAVAEPLLPPGPMTDELVMYVRSPVASYWRGRTYDTFDPDGREGQGEWLASKSEQAKPLPPPYLARRSQGDDDTRYLQTVFLHSDLGSTLLAGYEPIAASVPRGDDGKPQLSDGTTYQVVSSQPSLTQERLRNDRSRWLDARYSTLPDGMGYLHALTGQLTRDATTHFDRAVAIASYLHQLKMDETAASQLEPSGSLESFVFGEASGTSLDYATAMVLMARAAGLTARLATGYLPGSYNPLSGANKVDGQDAHVWAEIKFDRAGWVPFDPAPRPDMPVPSATVRSPSSGGLGFLLEHRLGDRLADTATRAPGAAFATIAGFFQKGLSAMAVMTAAGMTAALAWLTYRYVNERRSAAMERRRYARLDDGHRRAVLAAYRSAERIAAHAGFRKRSPAEPYAEYAAVVSGAFGRDARALVALARLAGRAAYSPQPLSGSAVAEARSLSDTFRSEMRNARAASVEADFREVSRAFAPQSQD